MMARCNWDPDKIFRQFKLVEFPASFVGLATTLEVDLETDVTGPCYLRTNFMNSLLTFDEARDISPDHRAFTMIQLNQQMVKMIFKPTNECISKAIKMQKLTDEIDNRFAVDLRAIRVDGLRCCNNIHHSEIGRYYFCGIFAYCDINHSPNIINFDVVLLKGHAVRTMRIRNDSKLSAKMTYIKTAGFDVTPRSFTIPAKSSKKVEISLNPNNHNVAKAIVFNIRNAYDPYTEPLNSGIPITDTNFLPYKITVNVKIKYGLVAKTPVIKSLQSIWEPNPDLTYLNEEIIKRQKQNDKAAEILKFAKLAKTKKVVTEKIVTGLECYSDPPKATDPRTFCKVIRPRITASDLFNVVFSPYCLDFGKVAINSHGQRKLLIQNSTKYDIEIRFLEHDLLVYTNSKHSTYSIRLKSMAEIAIEILCNGSSNYVYGTTYTFTYIIDNKFHLKQLFKLEVGNPILTVRDNVLKFGMITSETFVISVPVKIYNNYNVPINFEWQEWPLDAPFEISPVKGTVSEHSCKICDIRYLPRILKSKMYEIVLYSKILMIKSVIDFEAHIITRKLAIKFVQTEVHFRDIPLNLKVTEETRLENNSREISVFRVVEPLLPGVTVTPMEGTIKPKAVIIFIITVKITCVLEFYFDLNVRINNKENVGISVYGRVVEPKIVVHPRNVIMPRLPCGMITYVPVKFQNAGSAKSIIEVLQTENENIFKVYIQSGSEKEIVSTFTIEPGQSFTVFVRVYDVFRREYDQYIPFRVNYLLGPPIEHSANSTEMNYFIHRNIEIYDNNPKVHIRSLNRDIPYFHISGVFTLPWIHFSVEKFEINYVVCETNKISFEMQNISKYLFNVTMSIGKLYPNFSMDVCANSINAYSIEIISTDNIIKFELSPQQIVNVNVYFHPQRQGRFVGVAPLYLDSSMSTAYSNLTFIGKRENPEMKASVFRIAFPPCRVGREVSDTFTLDLEEASSIEMFRCSSKAEACIKVEFIGIEQIIVQTVIHSIVTVRVSACSDEPRMRTISLIFNHDLGSTCSVEVDFCFTHCKITLHTDALVSPKDNPYPYYPLETQTKLYEYLQRCVDVMEKWMYFIGFRRELFAEIPETYHAIAISLVGKDGPRKTKFKSITMVTYFKRIAGNLMKNIPKASYPITMDETLRNVKEIHDNYEHMIRLLRSRGAQVYLLRAKYLLTYDQFITLTSAERSKYICEDALFHFLIDNEDIFNRLTKQCWFDFLLQSYKVFILDSCLFDCVCISKENRDIVQILINWYNEQINITRQCIHGNTNKLNLNKVVTNLTTDLVDGLAIMCALSNHCSFLKKHLSLFCEVNNNEPGGVIHNACLFIEAFSILKIYFPISTQDFIEPNFLHMLMFSVHLYVLLPMFRQKSVVYFNPPLLRTSIRTLTISPTTQETLTFNFVILNNKHNCFTVDRVVGENMRKLYLNIKYFAKFVTDEQAVLLVHGHNKTRIFDTFMTFDLIGRTGALPPMRKYKITAPLYRPLKVDILVRSPFEETAPYTLYITEIEPTIPVTYEDLPIKGFYVKRMKLIDDHVTLTGAPLEPQADLTEHRLYFQMYCLSSQAVQLYLWFRSEIGEFFVKITSQPRWDVPVDTQQVAVYSWPIDPCSCGEDCECYRTTVVNIPHCNELMLKALRYALLEFATPLMIEYFDKLIGTETGQVIVMMLLVEGGTNPSEVAHILRPETTYHIFSRNVLARLDRATLRIHSDAVLSLPITIPPNEIAGKFTITLTSQCNMDIRNYRFLITVVEYDKSSTIGPKASAPLRNAISAYK